MKTFQEFYQEIYTQDLVTENVTIISPEERAAKEYAKQWVEEAVFWAEKQSEYGLPIINEVLPRIQKRIDEQ